MNSMTGFGKGIAESDGLTATVELKSVNHRFLDVALKLPRTVGFLEDPVRKALQGAFSRGHIDVYVSFSDVKTDDSVCSVVDFAKAAALVDAAKSLCEKFGLTNDFSVSSLMRSFDIVTLTAAPEDENRLAAVVLPAVCDAVSALGQMREKEGEALCNDMKEKLACIEENVTEIKSLASGDVDVYRNKLEARMREILQDTPVDEAKLLNEVAFYADHIAVDEETSRLDTHIAHARDLLGSTEPVGKKLDFLVQEMFRETNTIGSKCNNIAVTKLVLDNKNLIEKLREQVQNIE